MRASAGAGTLVLALLTAPGVSWMGSLEASQAAPAVQLPKVRLIATGGTISNRAGGRLTAEELVKSIPGVERYARADAEQFANVASSDLTLQQWLGLARHVNTLFKEDPELAGVVVTSGTDTLLTEY